MFWVVTEICREADINQRALMIKAFIHQPSRFRHTQMPDHTDLGPTELDELYRYLWTLGHEGER